jgi:uracil-DNA glycosylase
MQPFFESEKAWDIYQFLKKRGEDYKILPFSSHTFNAFKVTPLTELKLIVIGMEPYSGMLGKKPQSNGIAMDCENISPKLQPSLEYFYYGLQNSFPDLNIEARSSLKDFYNQGVLFINSSLTVEKNAIGTHLKLKSDEFPTKNLWEAFQKYIFQEIFFYENQCPIILLGADAQKLERYTDPFRNVVFKTNHPSFAARTFDKEWDADMVFPKANKYIEQTIGKDYIVKWDFKT